MLDWSRIDNDKRFQQLVNELFALELNKPGYKPSSPYIGADGGWDGRFDDPYRGLTGTSCVQAKWTKHSFDEAYPGLVREIKSELKNARTNKVANVLIATNAELRVGTDDHVGKLEALNTGNVQHLIVYYRAKLEELIERYRWLKFKYFGQPQHPLLVPADEYACESEAELYTGCPLLERGADIEAVKSFVAGSGSKVLLVHSPQGQGKSRFLIQAAESLHALAAQGWQGWLCRPSLRTVESAFQDEVHPDKKYVLFVDNADLYEAFTRALLGALKHRPASHLKVVLSCRPHNREIVANWARALRLETPQVLALRPLSETVAIELLTSASQGKAFEHPERIVRSLGLNPFFVVQYGKFAAGQEQPADLRRELRTVVESGAEVLRRFGLESTDALLLLMHVAAIVPYRHTDREVVASLAEVAGKPETTVEQGVKALVESGLLRTVGSTVRFNADITGSVFLGEVLSEDNGKAIVEDLWARWSTGRAEQLASNLAAAYHFSKSSQIRDVVSNALRTAMLGAEEAGDAGRRSNLAWLRYLAPVAPADVASLVSIYLELQESPASIGRDEYGPVILELLRTPGAQVEGLHLVRTVASRSLPGTYGNYRPETLVRTAVSPLTADSVDAAIAALAEVTQWPPAEEATLSLVVAAINEALGGSHEFDESYGDTLTFGRRSLVFTPKVAEYRHVAMQALHELLAAGSTATQVQAVSLIGEIGHDAPTAEGPLWERILADRREALQWLDTMFDGTPLPYALSAAVEDVLMRTWAEGQKRPDLSSKAEELLQKLDRTPEFLMYKFYTQADFIIPDFEPVRAAAPDEERWHWLVDTHMRFSRDIDALMEAVVGQLVQKYQAPEALIAFLQRLDAAIGGLASWEYVPLIEKWAHHDQAVVLAIVTTPALLAEVPERFLKGFYSVGAGHDASHLREYAEDLLAQARIGQDGIVRLIDIAAQVLPPTDEFVGWLQRLLPKVDAQGAGIVLDRVYWYFKGKPADEQHRAVEVLDFVLDRGYGTELLHSFEIYVYRLHSAGMVAESPRWAAVRGKLLVLLQDVERLDHQADGLLEILLKDDLAGVLNLIEARLRKAKNSEEYFAAIPHGSFECLNDLIASEADFCIVADRALQWSQAEFLYPFQLGELLQVGGQKLNEQGTSFAELYIRSRLAGSGPKAIEDAVRILRVVPLGSNTAALYADVLERANAVGLTEDAIGGLAGRSLAIGFSVMDGKVPPAVKEKQEALAWIRDKVQSARVKVQVAGIEESLREQVKRWIAEGEEE